MEDDFNLGFNSGYISDLDVYNSWLDAMVAANVTEIRVSIPNYDDAARIIIGKTHVAAVIAKGLRAIFGISADSLTAATWAAYEAVVLDTAAWAETNGVYEFQIGNELENINDDTTLTDTDVRNNILTLATAVKAVYTRGNVSYSCPGWTIDDWSILGKGDLDLLAANIYRGYSTFDDTWKTKINNLFSAFGNSCYISEFSLSSLSLDTYSTDEIIQSNDLNEMINYIKNLGIKKAFFFSYPSDEFGALKNNGVYRKLWDVLKIQNDWKRRKTASKSGLGGLSHG